MRIERDGHEFVTLTAQPNELAALISAARWAARTRPAGVPGEASDRLRTVLAQYDDQVRRLNEVVPATAV